MAYFIGVMSGTSLDAIDVALCDITSDSMHTLAFTSTKFEPELYAKLTVLCTRPIQHLENIGHTQELLAVAYANAINRILAETGIQAHDIVAIGCHGQTVWHAPNHSTPFTWQLLNPAKLAALTQIAVVSDFRAKDMAYGGQGAPLVPPFHHWLFKSLPANIENRVLVNIGGIANVSIFDKDTLLAGFDVGPGNTLLDVWYQRHNLHMYDKDGTWAAEGECQSSLLEAMLGDAYFAKSAPKSTGREYFNLGWIERYLGEHVFKPVDVQHTLSVLTAKSIIDAVQLYTHTNPTELLICGGGIHNLTLLEDLSHLLPSSMRISLLSDLGYDPDAIEAMAFAWLAFCHDAQIPSNAPILTGAQKPLVLGCKTDY
jgi:anhydro-N-acetylmuramic acid kinase